MSEEVKFVKQTDGSYELVVTMPETVYLQLNQILQDTNTSFQEIIDVFFEETIKRKRPPLQDCIEPKIAVSTT